MGAQDFVIRRKGTSIQDAFNKAYEEYREEYGDDIYNGTISTTDFCGDLTSNFKNSGLSIDAFVEREMDKIDKGDCYGFCIKKAKENTKKIKSTVTHNIEKGTKRWLLKYSVSNFDREIKTFDYKAEAVRFARHRTETTQQTHYINLIKVLDKGTPLCATVQYKKGNEQIGEYILFGLAKC